LHVTTIEGFTLTDLTPQEILDAIRRGLEATRREISGKNPLLERIAIDPQVCGGKPCIKGTRIWVSLVLDLLSKGMTEAELLAEYPQLAHEDVLAAIAYGAVAVRERVVPVPVF
jgi:uncharacterized protein (DUF433 family)